MKMADSDYGFVKPLVIDDSDYEYVMSSILMTIQDDIVIAYSEDCPGEERNYYLCVLDEGDNRKVARKWDIGEEDYRSLYSCFFRPERFRLNGDRLEEMW